MEFLNKIVTWAKENPLAATGAGLGIVGVTALLVSPKARKFVGLGSVNNSKPTDRRTKRTKSARNSKLRLTHAELQ